MARHQVLIGFDSAWTDNPRAPGAICAATFQDGSLISFEPPQLVRFNDALAYIEEHRSPEGLTLVALDQPTVVPNADRMRPVERIAAPLISWLGGGVQPANRGRKGMFCDAAPVWTFLQALSATQDPEASRTATTGLYVIEVFPALALASLDPTFFGRLAAPRYNPVRRKTYRVEDWSRVTAAAARHLTALDLLPAAAWCMTASQLEKPTKSDQDKLDSVLCFLVAAWWRTRDRMQSMVLGDVQTGYMVTPASAEVRDRLTATATALNEHAH